MSAESLTVELGIVLAELGSAARMQVGPADAASRPVRGSLVWLPGDETPADPAVLVVCAGLGPNPAADLAGLLAANPPLTLALCRNAQDVHDLELGAIPPDEASGPVAVTVAANASDVVTAVARATQTAEEAVSVRLGSLQRSLSLALADPAPVPALLGRLKRVTSGTAAFIDRHGQVTHATGPVPRSLLFEEVSSTRASTQSLNIDGWHGLAARIADPDSPDEHSGWLVVSSRRPDFVDAHVSAAVHVAASLIEASQRMGVVVRQQERAVRAAVLEQALAMRHERQDPELAARMAGLGIDFGREIRVVLAAFSAPGAAQRQQVSDSLVEKLSQVLGGAGVPALFTARVDGVTMLVESSIGSVQRLLASTQGQFPPLLIGIGRPVRSVDVVADSFHDAQLAVRTLRRVPQQSLMAYEDFDFATRLFSDVGLDRMVAWAEDFLSPLAERDNQLEGLRAYFEHDQNIKLAADALNIHHNSLRYRLSKVEEALTINLKQPAAVSSLFLALTALDLTRQPGALRPRGGRDPAGVRDVDATSAPTSFGESRSSPGVVRGSD